MKYMTRRSINKFAILVILMIAVPEATGHLLFERSYPTDSSVNAAVSFSKTLHDNAGNSGICHLTMQKDPAGADIARAAGLQGKYGDFTCA